MTTNDVAEIGRTARDRHGNATEDAPGGPWTASGVDVVSISRIADLLEEFDPSFAERAFTAAERAYCDRRVDPSQHYAARWAAKEAFYKTLADPSPSIPAAEIEVRREPTGPRLELGPSAATALADRLEAAGVDPDRTDRSVSLSHDRDRDVAVAQVVVVGELEGSR
ncbi:holo-ACP synthase [Natrialbaceae archaeon AArc-T1-2]|uniref:holo-ACP synthase n=1 Tax=Natrialbaceae archaeon AArc-T1-2 TaxID=3053904 RepID=UPI00255AD922|nr:holo-ACP synthase [Natrialbaceae archaeon AArc-T1-2]WIV65779.1 holo-ACP synthase [Natrialbaceae archaeon AArc-T1-2]